MYYLYVKTHSKTGLKYLGITNKKDPYKYRGSGKYWKSHLNKHGNDYSTTILLATNNKEELAETGLFFSKLWSISESNEWANLKYEGGYNAGQLGNVEFSERMKQSNKERVDNGKHHFLDSDVQRTIQNHRVKEGTHPFLTLAKERSKAGTHNWQGERNPMHKLVQEGIHLFQNREWSKEKARRQVENGTNAFVGGFYCIGLNGERKKMTKQEYDEQPEPKEFVHPCSKEARRRRMETN